MAKLSTVVNIQKKLKWIGVNMIAFIGMAVIALLVGVGVYAILTQVKIRDYRHETDKDGNEKVIDENE
jgi:hypothetical protein